MLIIRIGSFGNTGVVDDNMSHLISTPRWDWQFDGWSRYFC